MTARDIAIATMFTMSISAPAFAADDMAAPAEAPTVAPAAPEAPTVAPATGTSAALPSFDKVDADGNGSISSVEASAVPGLIDAFSVADADKSGDLSKTEYATLSHS